MSHQGAWVISWTETVQHHTTVDPGILGDVMTKEQFLAFLQTKPNTLTEWSEIGHSARTVFYHDIAVNDIQDTPYAGKPGILPSAPTQTGHFAAHHHDWGQT